MIRKTLNILKRYWWAIIILVVAAWLVYVAVNCHLWPNSNCTGFQGKTVWDVLELLIIPITLPIVAAMLDRFERKTDREIADKRAQTDREIAEKSAEVDREIALDNQRETALQNYLDTIMDLLLNKKLRESKPNDDVRDIAQVKTATTLERLDTDRKSKLIGFLCDMGLIGSQDESEPILKLIGTHLKGADLAGVFLERAQLMGTILMGVNLWGAKLFCANLQHANLEGAHLMDSDLQVANLQGANLKGANLRSADLRNAYLAGVRLEGANLKDVRYNKKTIWPTGFDPVAAGAVLVDD